MSVAGDEDLGRVPNGVYLLGISINNQWRSKKATLWEQREELKQPRLRSNKQSAILLVHQPQLHKHTHVSFSHVALVQQRLCLCVHVGPATVYTVGVCLCLRARVHSATWAQSHQTDSFRLPLTEPWPFYSNATGSWVHSSLKSLTSALSMAAKVQVSCKTEL